MTVSHMSRRAMLKGATALGALAAESGAVLAQGPRRTAPLPLRREFVIRNATVLTMDPNIADLARGDVHVRDGAIVAIGPRLNVRARAIDANGMICMPGIVDTHWHLWTTLFRPFVRADIDEVGYFPVSNRLGQLMAPEDSYRSVRLGVAEALSAGVTTVHNWAHNVRTPAHADAELRAHRESLLRARYSYGHIDQMPPDQVQDFSDVDRVKRDYFSKGAAFDGLVHFGYAIRALGQATPEAFNRDMEEARRRGLPIAVHASQAPPSSLDAVDYEKRGWLGPNLLVCHYIPARDVDAEALARTRTPLSFATHSEFRLGLAGDPRIALLRMRKAGVVVSLSSDATSIAPPNMLENMRFAWNMGIPWRGTPSEGSPPVGFREVIEMGTLNGAKALGLGEETGSLSVGKRADLILIRGNDLNVAPIANIETSVVQSATPANVDTVMVDGRIVKRGGRLVAYDVEKIVRNAKASALRIRKEAGGLLTPK
jgi:5-methylthioadenosine/S-adenosylhomocysteine deaminase